MSPRDLKAPMITSKQKRQLIDYNKFPSSFASMARKTFSNIKCVVCGLEDSDVEVLERRGWKWVSNLHNKPFCMQTFKQCQLKPMSEYIKFALHHEGGKRRRRQKKEPRALSLTHELGQRKCIKLLQVLLSEVVNAKNTNFVLTASWTINCIES